MSTNILPLLTQRVFNRPLLIHPGMAESIYAMLGGRIDVNAFSIEALQGVSPEASQFKGSKQREDGTRRATRAMGKTAIITIDGSLVTGVGGTGNVITAAFSSGVDPAVCRVGVLTPAANNTGAVTLNGEAIKDRTGNPLSAGALAAGVSTLLLRDGAAWRLLTGNIAEISDVSGLQAALNGKVDPTAMAAAIASAISGLVNGAGAALDTLNELSAALGNDPNFSTTILTTLGMPNQIANATDATIADGDHWGFRRFAGGILIKRTTLQVIAYFFARLGVQIAGGTVKAIPVDADMLAINDSQSSNATKVVGLTQLWANYLKAKADAVYIALSSIATAAQYRAKAAGAILTADKVYDAAVPVLLGGALTGNITLDLATFIHAYGTATGNIVFNAVANPRNQSGTIELTTSGADRTVGLTATAFSGAAVTIPNGQTWLFSYFLRQGGKVHLSVLAKNI